MLPSVNRKITLQRETLTDTSTATIKKRYISIYNSSVQKLWNSDYGSSFSINNIVDNYQRSVHKIYHKIDGKLNLFTSTTLSTPR